MTFSIIGLVIVQLYWLNQAFQAGENEFNSRVMKAMDETVHYINQTELNQYYKLFNETRKTMKDSLDAPQVITSQIESDSANVKYVYLTRYMMDKVALPVSGIYNDSLNITELYSSERAIKLRKDSSLGNFQPINVNLESEFKDASFTLERFAQFDAGNKPISRRIDLNKIDSVFHKKLKKWNAKTPFELGVLANDSASITMQTKSFSATPDNYLTPLFYDKNDNPSYYLSVLLPEKSKTIYSRISGLFAITILFTFIILTIYAISLYAMSRQRQISQMKTDFMNNMTHELKTPLATISVATDALKSKMVSTDSNKVKHYANLIKQENKRMNNQVEMVLRMSKLERNEIKLDKSKIHVNDLVKESVDSIRLIVENRNGTIFENYKAEKDKLPVDSFHLGNIILNILDNANKYSKEAPQITIETYNTNSHYIIKVSDLGMGMSKQVLGKIFDKFYREETGNVHNIKGHGLGLAYVKHIIELHGGEVNVESEKGKGSRFYLNLPLK